MISKKLKAGGAVLALSTALMLGSSVCAYAQAPDEVNTQSTAASTETGAGSQTGAAAGSEAGRTVKQYHRIPQVSRDTRVLETQKPAPLREGE
jgi:hypothetical protein